MTSKNKGTKVIGENLSESIAEKITEDMTADIDLKKAKKFIKKSTVYILMTVIFFVACFFILRNRVKLYLKESSYKMQESINTAEYLYGMQLYHNDILYEFDNLQYDFYAKSTVDYLNNAPVTQERIDAIEEELSNVNIYFYTKDGKVLHGENSLEAPEINEKAENVLKDTNSYRDEDHVYNSFDCKEGRLLLIWNFTSSYYSLVSSPLNAYDEDYIDAIIIDKSTKETLASTDSLLRYNDIWKNTRSIPFPSFDKNLVYDISMNSEYGICVTKDTGVFIYMKRDGSINKYVLENGFTSQSDLKSNISTISMIPLKHMLITCFNYSFRQILLLLFVFILTGRLAFFLSVSEEAPKKKTKKKLKLHWGEFQKATSLFKAYFLVAVIITLALTSFLQVLAGYSSHIQDSEKTLNLLSRAISENKKELNNTCDDLSASYDKCLKFIDFMASDNPAYTKNAHLKDVISYFSRNEELSFDFVTSVSFFDENGVCTASTDDYVGYTLTKDESSEQSRFWNLLDGAQYSYHTDISQILENYDPISRNQNDIYFARLRNNNQGIIVMKVSIAQYLLYKTILGQSTVFQSVNKGIGKLCYVEIENPGSVYYTVNNNNNILTKIADYTFSSRLMKGKYRGEYMLLNPVTSGADTALNSGLYYVSELKLDDLLYINFIPEMDILRYSISGTLIMIFAFLALYIVLIKYVKPGYKLIRLNNKAENDEWLDDNILNASEDEIASQNQEEAKLSNLFFKYVKYLLEADVALILLTTIFSIFVLKSNTIDFLTNSHWRNKVNIVSITNIIAAGVIIYVVAALIIRFISYISDNIGSKATTVGQMLCSLVQLIGTLVFIIFSLVQLGLKMSYLLTGAGIAGVVISYCGQGLISDLLIGLFIVSEGNLKVGDTIKIDDWRGSIEKIGVRTTILNFCGERRIYNNSRLTNVTILGRTMAGAIAFVDIDYGEDIEEVMELINSNTERYRREIPYILEGPTAHGVTELGASGVTLRIGAIPSDTSKISNIQRDLLRVTKKIFDENGITIPFPQVVVHQEKTYEHEQKR